MNNENTTPVASAEAMWPEVFAPLDEIIQRLHEWIDLAHVPEEHSFVAHVKASVVVRAFNQFRAIVSLLRHNHWEDALILTRALFELLLNVEEVFRHHDRMEAMAERFWRFGELQEYLFRRADFLYNLQTGRLPPAAQQQLDANDKAVRAAYATFWRTKKGRGHWQTSWCGRTVKDLASVSSNPMRAKQYETIYAHASGIVHGGPTAVSSVFLHRDASEDVSLAIQRSRDREEQGLRLVASFASALLLELLTLVGDRLPDYEHDWVVKMIPRVMSGIFGMSKSGG